jgi:O-antigen/teichoic acid export membrane protein
MQDSDQKTSRKSHFSLDILTLVTGTTISQIITVLAAPVITRLYGPEAFGLVAIFTSITSFISAIICLRYEPAIMLPKSDKEAANVFGLCLLIVLILSILSIPLLILSQPSIEAILKSSQIGNYFWLIPPSIFLSGIFVALNYWNTRTKQFPRLAIVQIMQTGSTTGIEIGFGIAGYATGGILIGTTLIGQLVSTLGLGIQIMREDISFFLQNISIREIITAFGRYINFPKYSILAVLLNNFCLILPVLFLTAYFNPTLVGYYSLGLMVLQFPLSFVQNAISQVFFQKAAEAKNISHQKLKEVVEQSIKPLIFLAFIPVILFILIGPELFSVVFGARWAEAGNYVRFLSLWVGIRFISSPFSNLFSILEKQHITIILTILELIFPLGAIIIGSQTGNALITIILFSTAGFIVNAVTYGYLLQLSKISVMVPVKIVADFLLLCVPFILCTLLFQILFAPNLLLIVISSVLLFCLYPLLVIKRDTELSHFFKNITTSIPLVNQIAKHLF